MLLIPVMNLRKKQEFYLICKEEIPLSVCNSKCLQYFLFYLKIDSAFIDRRTWVNYVTCRILFPMIWKRDISIIIHIVYSINMKECTIRSLEQMSRSWYNLTQILPCDHFVAGLNFVAFETLMEVTRCEGSITRAKCCS